MLPQDSLQHEYHKILSQRITNTARVAEPENPPPAYTPSATMPHARAIGDDLLIEADEEDDDVTDYHGSSQAQAPLSVHLDATTKIVGHGNLVAIEATALASRVAAGIFAAIKSASEDGSHGSRPIAVTISCGTNIVGSRNAIGPLANRQNLDNGNRRSSVMLAELNGESLKRKRADSAPPPTVREKRNKTDSG